MGKRLLPGKRRHPQTEQKRNDRKGRDNERELFREHQLTLRDRSEENGFIRASAGTGKTYSMTALFARLITESITFSDDGSAGGAPLDLRRILVVTFTEKGTADLKRDIRKESTHSSHA